KAPLLFESGARGVYSDAGYFLLGVILEKASGETYREFMQKRGFDRLQMTNARGLDKWRVVKGGVPVYTIRNGELAHWRRDWQYELNAFAGVCSSVEDLVKWDAALRNGALLKRASLDQMWTPAKLNSGRDAMVFGDAYGFG